MTLGATATTAFVISPDFGTPVTYTQSATTTHEGTPSTLATGDDTTALPLGTYLIREMTPSPARSRNWRLASAICNGLPVATAGGGAAVTLTRDRPKIDCTITNEFVPGPEPPVPPNPSPPVPAPTPLPGPGDRRRRRDGIVRGPVAPGEPRRHEARDAEAGDPRPARELPRHRAQPRPRNWRGP